MATKEPQLSKVDRREVARAQALKLQQEQVRREKRTRAVIIASLVAGVLLFAGIAFLILQKQGPDLEGIKEFPSDIDVPSVADDAGGISFGASGEAGSTSGDDAVRVEIYLDYMCPVCGALEASNGPALDELRTAGDIDLVVHAISILDRASQGTAYSTRSAQAFSYIAENSPEHALAFDDALFTNQPAENTQGLSDDELRDIAVGVGVPEDVADGLAEGEYDKYVEAHTALAFGNTELLNPESGNFGTPTIVIDGERFAGNWQDPGALPAAIAAARGDAPVAD